MAQSWIPAVAGMAGRVRLEVSEAPEYRYPIGPIHRTDTPPGPAGAWLAERLAG